MALFKLDLVRNGFIAERFYLEENNWQSCLSYVRSFKWGGGQWRISEIVDGEEFIRWSEVEVDDYV